MIEQFNPFKDKIASTAFGMKDVTDASVPETDGFVRKQKRRFVYYFLCVGFSYVIMRLILVLYIVLTFNNCNLQFHKVEYSTNNPKTVYLNVNIPTLYSPLNIQLQKCVCTFSSSSAVGEVLAIVECPAITANKYKDIELKGDFKIDEIHFDKLYSVVANREILYINVTSVLQLRFCFLKFSFNMSHKHKYNLQDFNEFNLSSKNNDSKNNYKVYIDKLIINEITPTMADISFDIDARSVHLPKWLYINTGNLSIALSDDLPLEITVDEGHIHGGRITETVKISVIIEKRNVTRLYKLIEKVLREDHVGVGLDKFVLNKKMSDKSLTYMINGKITDCKNKNTCQICNYGNTKNGNVKKNTTTNVKNKNVRNNHKPQCNDKDVDQNKSTTQTRSDRNDKNKEDVSKESEKTIKGNGPAMSFKNVTIDPCNQCFTFNALFSFSKYLSDGFVIENNVDDDFLSWDVIIQDNIVFGFDINETFTSKWTTVSICRTTMLQNLQRVYDCMNDFTSAENKTVKLLARETAKLSKFLCNEFEYTVSKDKQWMSINRSYTCEMNSGSDMQFSNYHMDNKISSNSSKILISSILTCVSGKPCVFKDIESVSLEYHDAVSDPQNLPSSAENEESSNTGIMNDSTKGKIAGATNDPINSNSTQTGANVCYDKPFMCIELPKISLLHNTLGYTFDIEILPNKYLVFTDLSFIGQVAATCTISVGKKYNLKGLRSVQLKNKIAVFVADKYCTVPFNHKAFSVSNTKDIPVSDTDGKKTKSPIDKEKIDIRKGMIDKDFYCDFTLTTPEQPIAQTGRFRLESVFRLQNDVTLQLLPILDSYIPHDDLVFRKGMTCVKVVYDDGLSVSIPYCVARIHLSEIDRLLRCTCRDFLFISNTNALSATACSAINYYMSQDTKSNTEELTVAFDQDAFRVDGRVYNTIIKDKHIEKDNQIIKKDNVYRNTFELVFSLPRVVANSFVLGNIYIDKEEFILTDQFSTDCLSLMICKTEEDDVIKLTLVASIIDNISFDGSAFLRYKAGHTYGWAKRIHTGTVATTIQKIISAFKRKPLKAEHGDSVVPTVEVILEDTDIKHVFSHAHETSSNIARRVVGNALVDIQLPFEPDFFHKVIPKLLAHVFKILPSEILINIKSDRICAMDGFRTSESDEDDKASKYIFGILFTNVNLHGRFPLRKIDTEPSCVILDNNGKVQPETKSQDESKFESRLSDLQARVQDSVLYIIGTVSTNIPVSDLVYLQNYKPQFPLTDGIFDILSYKNPRIIFQNTKEATENTKSPHILSFYSYTHNQELGCCLQIFPDHLIRCKLQVEGNPICDIMLNNKQSLDGFYKIELSNVKHLGLLKSLVCPLIHNPLVSVEVYCNDTVMLTFSFKIGKTLRNDIASSLLGTISSVIQVTKQKLAPLLAYVRM